MAFSSAFGLRIWANRSIPGLGPVADEVNGADVRVWLGIAPPVPADESGGTQDPDPEAPPEVRPVAGGRYFRFRYGDGTEFVIDRPGSRVWATWPEPWTVEDAATYLLGPILGFVLRLRGVVCLHASAVAVGDRAVVLLGPSGAGKSTTAAAFGASASRSSPTTSWPWSHEGARSPSVRALRVCGSGPIPCAPSSAPPTPCPGLRPTGTSATSTWESRRSGKSHEQGPWQPSMYWVRTRPTLRHRGSTTRRTGKASWHWSPIPMATACWTPGCALPSLPCWAGSRRASRSGTSCPTPARPGCPSCAGPSWVTFGRPSRATQRSGVSGRAPLTSHERPSRARSRTPLTPLRCVRGSDSRVSVS